MPLSPKYWTLTDEQFHEIKTQLNELGKMFLDNLRENGFTKIKSRDHWLSFTIEKSNKDLFAFIAFSLIRESPPEFELILRKLDIKSSPEPFVELYEKKIVDIDEFKSSFDTELAMIKEKIKADKQ